MRTFKRIMIGLDFSLMDDSILEYFKAFSSVVKVEQVYLTHIVSPNSDGQIGKIPKDELAAMELKNKVSAYFEYGNFKVDTAIGSTVKELCNRIRIKEIDLLIVGQKSFDSKNITEELARKSTCSVLLVPPLFKARFESLLVCCDYSESSKLALQAAVSLMENQKEAAIDLVHVYNYHKYYDNQGMLLRISRIFQEEYEQFIQGFEKLAPRICPVNILNINYLGTDYIKSHAQENDSDLVIVAPDPKKFRVFRWIWGGFTEKLIKNYQDKPVLIVK